MNSGSPIDKNMILAIVAALVLYIGWQSYLNKKYPEYYTKKPKTAETSDTQKNVADVTATSNQTETTGMASAPEIGQEKPASDVENTVEYSDEIWSLTFSSKGMGLKKIQLKKFSDRESRPIEFLSAEGHRNFSTNLIGRAKDLDFVIRQTQDKQFVGVAEAAGNRIVKTVNIDSKNYILNTQIRVEKMDESFAGVTTELSDYVKPAAASFFLMPQYEFHEFYVQYEATDERSILSHSENTTQNYSKAHLISLSSQYFATALLDKSSVLPDFKSSTLPEEGRAKALGILTYTRLGSGQEFNISYSAFAGPKSYRLLEGIDPKMSQIVNFGFFQSIARVIFRVLDSIHNVVGNWGWAIVLLTILVRLLVLPFNLMSYRSMKGMAAIQPEMKVLREKYKNDPQRLNQEMLQLMKEAKANPLGGCLPMLLQIPIFFALYQVLGQSIELYKAPFVLWIQDLSYRDPFFVLPILMGVTLYFQQKITPTTLEPAQQKVMMFLPVIFSVFMLTLPSGLTLYIFVSGLFAVLQQIYFMRNDKKQGVKAN